MSQSWQMDPHKRDYVMKDGAPVETDSLQVPAYFRLRAKRKQWLYAPDDQWGSDYYTLKKLPPANPAQTLENVGLEALQPLLDDGRASQVTVTADQVNRGGAALTTEIVDASGEVQTVTFNSLGV